jgi:hypothetical protein
MGMINQPLSLNTNYFMSLNARETPGEYTYVNLAVAKRGRSFLAPVFLLVRRVRIETAMLSNKSPFALQM